MDVGHIEQSNVASGLCALIQSCYCGPDFRVFLDLDRGRNLGWVTGSIGIYDR